MNVILEVWREACRHADMGAALERIASVVGDQIHADFLAIRRVEIEREQLDTVAIAGFGAAPLPHRGRSHCSSEQIQDILEWARIGRLISTRREPRHPLLPLLTLTGGGTDTIVGPLSTPGGPVGALV